MNTPKDLNDYLNKLDRALGAVPAADRADILVEIKGHVMEALDRDPTQTAGRVLASMGEPEQVASRYLLERGLKPQKPPRHPIVKWLVIGFLGTFAISAIAVIVIVSSFTPLIKVNEDKGEVSMLGGMIDINEKDARVKVRIGGESFEMSENKEAGTHNVAGTKKWNTADLKREVRMQFPNGRVILHTSQKNEIVWECSNARDKANVEFQDDGKSLNIDFSPLRWAKCEVALPKGSLAKAEAKNGKLVLRGLRFNATTELRNGEVSITPADGEQYLYNLNVSNGSVDEFENSKAKNAWKVSVQLGNGRIQKDDLPDVENLSD